jgi:hypothetical protein
VEIPSVEREKEKYENYRNTSHSLNLFQYCKLMPSKNYININKKWLKLQLLNLIKYGNDTDNFQFTLLDYDDNNNEDNNENQRICICQFEKKYEETKYGPLILLFSNAKYCNSYNKIFSDIEFIGIFLKEKYEKLQEWPKFSQYSYFDEKDEGKIDIEKLEPDNNNTNAIEKTDTNSNADLILDNKRERIEKFFVSDNGQEEEHTIEESICWPLIGQQNYKPYFYFCKEHPKVENINLISIERHIRLAEPERHKAKLHDLLVKEKGGAKN